MRAGSTRISSIRPRRSPSATTRETTFVPTAGRHVSSVTSSGRGSCSSRSLADGSRGQRDHRRGQRSLELHWAQLDSSTSARPNPLVERGDIGSGLIGAALEYRVGTVQARLDAEAEQSFETPDLTFVVHSAHARTDRSSSRPSLRSDSASDVHAVATAGDSTPRARFAYLGRNGTLPLLELLQLGGDQLVFVESRYEIPIGALVLPKLGSPTLELGHYMGTAGVGIASGSRAGAQRRPAAQYPAIRGDVRRRRGSRLARLRLDRIGPVASRGAHCLLT